MRKRRFSALIVSALCLLLTFVLAGERFGLLAPTVSGAEAVLVSRATMTRALELDGTLGCEDKHTVYATGAGRVSEVFAQVGRPVAEGDLLLKWEDSRQLAAVRAALNATAAARSVASAVAERLTELDAPDLAALSPALFGAFESDAALSAALSAYNETRLAAPASGKVIRLYVEPGQVVAAGAPVCEIGGDKNVLTIPLSDADASRAYIGQRVTALRDGIEVGSGTLIRIEPQRLPATQAGQPTAVQQPFATGTVRLDEPLEQLAVGATLNCMLLFDELSAICVPLEAIGAGDTVLVAVQEGGAVRARRMAVKCGIVEGPLIQLLEGPPEGTAVLLNNSLPDGVRLSDMVVRQ